MKKSAEELDIMGERRGMHIIDPVLERTCPVCGTVCNHRLSHTRRGGIVSCDNLACRATYCSYRTPQWIVDRKESEDYRLWLLELQQNPYAEQPRMKGEAARDAVCNHTVACRKTKRGA